jgi:outer membrane lipoprotein-sorting protein
MNILRRIPLSRLLLLCALVVALGVSATALASALGSGPTPPPKPLATAVHDALSGPSVEGVSATVQLTNHLLEGANLASGSGEASALSSSPLLSGASGRLWVSKDGRLRLELQAEKGDTQILYDGHTLTMYDASTNTLYRYTPPARAGADPAPGSACPPTCGNDHEPPSVAKIEEAIAHLRRHADVSEPTPTDVAGQAAYTVRVSPKETGSLLDGAELSFDAVHGLPLRAAVYSSTSSSAVIELAASSISYGPVEESVFSFTPPPGVKVHDLAAEGNQTQPPEPKEGAGQPHVTVHGHGVSAVAVLEGRPASGSNGKSALPEGLPKVQIDGASATELATSLGTLLEFERGGVRYLLVGSVTPAAIEAVARGL